MGGKFTRVFRNFNLENRAHRVIGKEKPAAAPLHPPTEEALQAMRASNAEIQDKMNRKDNILLSRLQEVYVASSDPPAQVTNEVVQSAKEECRRPQLTMKSGPFSSVDVENVPMGKISILEALTLLNNHKHSPDTWTAEKVASEYNLELKDSESLLQYFIPFDVKIIPPKDTKQITEE
ncbi:hypothetical protein FKM82_010883 [Ascaphus truei]